MTFHHLQTDEYDALHDRRSVLMAFIGSGFDYSRQTCKMVASEFGSRCRMLADLDALDAADDLGELRLVVVDEVFGEELVERLADLPAAINGASFALAYHSPEAARRIFARCRYPNGAKGPIVGFLPIATPLEVWLAVLRLLLHHQVFVPQELVPAEMPPPTPCADMGRLTKRETAVLHLLSDGDSNKVIASQLGISEHTVKLHIHNLTNKLGVSNRTSAARMYIRAVDHNAHDRA